MKPKVHWIKGSLKHGGTLDFNSHVIDSDGTLYFRGVQMSDAGLYTCVAHVADGAHQAYINKTIVVDVVGRYKCSHIYSVIRCIFSPNTHKICESVV